MSCANTVGLQFLIESILVWHFIKNSREALRDVGCRPSTESTAHEEENKPRATSKKEVVGAGMLSTGHLRPAGV